MDGFREVGRVAVGLAAIGKRSLRAWLVDLVQPECVHVCVCVCGC